MGARGELYPESRENYYFHKIITKIRCAVINWESLTQSVKDTRDLRGGRSQKSENGRPNINTASFKDLWMQISAEQTAVILRYKEN